MHSLSFVRLLVLLVLFLGGSVARGQQGQTMRIIKGKKVTLRADAENALSYIWFRNGEPLTGLHDSRVVVMEDGKYTVIALGNGCNSDLSDPVEIIVDPLGEDIYVDLAIRILPEVNQALLHQEFNIQLLVLNNSPVTVEDVSVAFLLSDKLEYLGIDKGSRSDVSYSSVRHELIWQLPKLQAKEAASQWVRVRGKYTGQAMTTGKVMSRHEDVEPANSIAQAAIDIVAIFVPNVFTPNSDGKNDTFEIVGLDLFRTSKLIVFNRNGNEVYSSKNYKNDWHGGGLNEGTYFYYLEMEDWSGNRYTQKGYVLLMRSMVVH